MFHWGQKVFFTTWDSSHCGTRTILAFLGHKGQILTPSQPSKSWCTRPYVSLPQKGPLHFCGCKIYIKTISIFRKTIKWFHQLNLPWCWRSFSFLSAIPLSNLLGKLPLTGVVERVVNSNLIWFLKASWSCEIFAEILLHFFHTRMIPIQEN